MKRVLVLNGPNLGELGRRQPEFYGTATYDDLVALCTGEGERLGFAVQVRQSDDEATMLGWLHGAGDEADAVILNAAAWGHYSYALRDAVAMVRVPVLDVHLSNPYGRDEFRRRSVLSDLVVGTIAGFGQDSYRLALIALTRLLAG